MGGALLLGLSLEHAIEAAEPAVYTCRQHLFQSFQLPEASGSLEA